MIVFFDRVEKIAGMNVDQTVPEEIVHSILNVYNECVLHPDTNLKNDSRDRKETNDLH